MPQKLTGKIAVIVGGTGGCGKSTARMMRSGHVMNGASLRTCCPHSTVGPTESSLNLSGVFSSARWVLRVTSAARSAPCWGDRADDRGART